MPIYSPTDIDIQGNNLINPGNLVTRGSALPTTDRTAGDLFLLDGTATGTTAGLYSFDGRVWTNTDTNTGGGGGGGDGNDPDARHLSAVDTGSISIPFSQATTVTLTLGEIILTGFDSSFDTSTVTRGARLFLEETDTDNAGFLYEGRVQAITNTSLIIVPEQAQFAITRMFVVGAGGSLDLTVPDTTSASGFLGADNLIVGSETFLNIARVDGAIELGGNVTIDTIGTTSTDTSTAIVRNSSGVLVEADIDFPAQTVPTEIDFLNQTEHKQFWEGTLAEYNAITTYDGDVQYYITDDGGVGVDDGSIRDEVTLAGENTFTALNTFDSIDVTGAAGVELGTDEVSGSLSFNGTQGATNPVVAGFQGGITTATASTGGLEIRTAAPGLSFSTSNFLTINGNGLSMTNGSFITPSGGGIQFEGRTGTAANLLNDYEEGTWTPTILNFADEDGVTTPTTSSGTYVKIGSAVTLTGVFTFGINTDFSAISIGSLPFNAVVSQYGSFARLSNETSAATTNLTGCIYLNVFSSTFTNVSLIDGDGATLQYRNEGTAPTTIRFTVTYQTT
ncbi:MAG: hypothetical protein K0U41_06965 [Gammaproteobacteria bacterium]|nr:hypothetical protein [Gammaproteobacteria bacterium]